MIIPITQEGWEALSGETLKEFSDLQLKKALQDHFGLRSQVYFMKVQDKRDFISNPDDRPTIQAEAEGKQTEHREAGAAHKGKAAVNELIEKFSEGRSYKFEGVERPSGGFEDVFSQRTAKIAYVIEDTEDGAQFPVQKRTAKTLEELGRLEGFDDRLSVKRQKPAHKAGFDTFEDVIAGADDEVQEAASDLASAVVETETETETASEFVSKVAEIVAEGDAEAQRGDESALDNILDSFPV